MVVTGTPFETLFHNCRHLISIVWATWVVWEAIEKYSLILSLCALVKLGCIFVQLHCVHHLSLLPPARFWKTAGGIVLGSIAVSAIPVVPVVPTVSAVSADVLPYISVAIKASFLKLGMCNICKNNIAKMFLVFFKFKIVHLIEIFLIFGKKSSARRISKTTEWMIFTKSALQVHISL